MFDFERRAHPRYPLRLRVTVRMRPTRTKARGVLMDLSRGGLLLKTKLDLPLGSDLLVLFKARPNLSCEGRGRVVRVMNTPVLRGVGISFDRINDRFDQLLTLLERLAPELRHDFLKESIERELVLL